MYFRVRLPEKFAAILHNYIPGGPGLPTIGFTNATSLRRAVISCEIQEIVTRIQTILSTHHTVQ